MGHGFGMKGGHPIGEDLDVIGVLDGLRRACRLIRRERRGRRSAAGSFRRRRCRAEAPRVGEGSRRPVGADYAEPWAVGGQLREATALGFVEFANDDSVARRGLQRAMAGWAKGPLAELRQRAGPRPPEHAEDEVVPNLVGLKRGLVEVGELGRNLWPGAPEQAGDPDDGPAGDHRRAADGGGIGEECGP